MAEKTIEQLLAENKELQEEAASLKAEITSYLAQLTSLKEEVASLENENASQLAGLTSLKEEVETVTSVNDELQAKIVELSEAKSFTEAANKIVEQKSAKIPAETFEVEGKKYKFISPVFMHKKQRITAENALADSSLLAELVSIKSGSIVEA
jgi:chromosome segregation ATPase